MVQKDEYSEMRNPVKSHSDSAPCRTVRTMETLVEAIVHQVCGMFRIPLTFLWDSPIRESL